MNVYFNERGETLLHLLCANAVFKIEQVQQILENREDLNVLDICGRSPVHYAVIYNKTSFGLDVLQLLLEKGGDGNLLDEKNLFAPVHYAAQSKSEMVHEQMKILLKNGGDATQYCHILLPLCGCTTVPSGKLFI